MEKQQKKNAGRGGSMLSKQKEEIQEEH